MAPRILILGGTGMLGSMLWTRLSRVTGWSVRRSHRRDPRLTGWFDALDSRADLDGLLASDGGVDYVINAIGATKRDIQEGDSESLRLAEELNSNLPRRLAAAASRHGARVIHISTNGVFSGGRGPYFESDSPAPDDSYGRTKLAGEVPSGHVLTIRCSIVGPDPELGRGLFEWFRRLGDGAHAPGFIDQKWNGVTTLQFADLCKGLIEAGAFDSFTSLSPIRHFCPNTTVTKYELLRLFAAALEKEIDVLPVESGNRIGCVLGSKWNDLTAIVGGPTAMAAAINSMVEFAMAGNPNP